MKRQRTHASTATAAALSGALDAALGALVVRWVSAKAGKPRAIHRARVATRRWREVLALVAAGTSAGEAKRLGKNVRRITRALGPVRELDVAIDELGRGAARDVLAETDRIALQARLEERRASRYDAMAEDLADVDHERLIARGRDASRALLMSRVVDVAWRRLLGARIAERAGDVKIALDECGTLYAPERLHVLRIAVKKLRYALEIARTIGLPEVAKPIAALRRAQGELGHLHDVQILVAEIAHVTAAKHRPNASRGMAALTEHLERHCREVHAKLLTRFASIEDAAVAAKRAARGARSAKLRMARAGTRPTAAAAVKRA